MEIQWSLVAFTAITAVGGWMAVCIAADEFLGKAKKSGFVTSLVAFIVTAVGGLASVTHLSHPENIMGAFGHPTSGIFTEALITGILCLFLLILLIMKKRGMEGGAVKVVAIIAGIAGIAISFSVGMSYMMESRPSWNTPLLPIGYLGTAIPMGIAAFMLVARKKEADADLAPYGKALMVGGILAALTALIFFFVAGSFTAGPIIMVIVCVLLDGCIAIYFGLKFSKKNEASSFKTLIIVLVCVFVGGVCFRIMMWLVATPIADLFGIAI